MAWQVHKRLRRGIVWRDPETGKGRVSLSASVMHYESVRDSGVNDTPVDISPVRVNNAQLNGWRVTSAGYHFAYQGFPAVDQQPEQGTLGFGGRGGQNWLKIIPHRVGYLHWPTRDFTAIGGAPAFNTPSLDIKPKTVGFVNDDNPVSEAINVMAVATIPSIWSTPGGGVCDWEIKIFGGQLKQSFIINQQARDWIATNSPPTTPAVETWFGIISRIDASDIPKWVLNDSEVNRNSGDYEFSNNLRFRDAQDKLLAHLDIGDIFVPNRGGRVDIRKRIFKSGNDWFYAIGANVAEMNQNLLPGDLVIDPAISEEDITQNSDDAHESGDGTMYLSGYDNSVYFTNDHWVGWRFQSIPVPQGATIDLATLEPVTDVSNDPQNVSADIYCEDIDDSPTFTTTANDISNRTVTTATTTVTDTDFTATGVRNSWDVSSLVEEVIGRGGWASDNDLSFIVDVGYVPYGDRVTFDDYNGGATNAADLNIEYTAAGGGPRGPLGHPLHGPFGGPVG